MREPYNKYQSFLIFSACIKISASRHSGKSIIRNRKLPLRLGQTYGFSSLFPEDDRVGFYSRSFFGNWVVVIYLPVSHEIVRKAAWNFSWSPVLLTEEELLHTYALTYNIAQQHTRTRSSSSSSSRMSDWVSEERFTTGCGGRAISVTGGTKKQGHSRILGCCPPTRPCLP